MSIRDSGVEYPFHSPNHDSVPRSFDHADAMSLISSTSSLSDSSSRGSSQSNYTFSSGTLGFYDDDPRMPDECSVSTVPSTHTRMSTLGQGIAQQMPPAPPSRRPLGCEFKSWTGCQHTFPLDEIDLWIRHIDDDHLRGKYPTTCICWYCDDFNFNTERTPDAILNFYNRMRHIADHIMDGDRFDERRPDFHFLDHVYRMGFISLEVFRQAQRISEGPSAPGIYPWGWRPEKPELATIEVAGHDRRRRKSHERHP